MSDKTHKYILAIDLGSTGIRSIIFDRNLNMIAGEYIESLPKYPQPSQVEYDLEVLWSNVKRSICDALVKADLEFMNITAIGISTQRNALTIWKNNCHSLSGYAIGWQDQRCASLTESLKREGFDNKFGYVTGTTLSSSSLGVKLRWQLDQQKELRTLFEEREYLFGTLDTWLIWKLTEGNLYITDISSAATTGLVNLIEKNWYSELLSFFNLENFQFPEIKPSSCIYGSIHTNDFKTGALLGGACVDQQAALFGHRCFEGGMAKCTLGTGAFLMVNLRGAPIIAIPELKTRIAWTINNQTAYAIEGMIYHCGSIISWLRSLGLIKSPEESEQAAASVSSSDGVYFVPALSGLASPYWKENARACFSGLSLTTSREHLVRAALESIAFQIRDVYEVIKNKTEIKESVIRVDGGVASNKFVLQFLADILRVPVECSTNLESTAMGIAMLTSLSLKWWRDPIDIPDKKNSVKSIFNPIMSRQQSSSLYDGWQKAVHKVLA